MQATVRQALMREPDLELVGELASVRDVIATASAVRPDIVLLDVSTRRAHAFELLGDLCQLSRVLLLASHIDNQDVVRSLELGARGVVLKRDARATLSKSIRAVLHGEIWISRRVVPDVVARLTPQAMPVKQSPDRHVLTAREKQVIDAVAAGASNSIIAARLGVTRDTIKHHLTNIFNKTGTGNRLELALFALERGLVQSEKS
jgi:DNA-binding NarL/FixJ family response regulator